MQMFSSRDAFENDFCPVRDELLGEMYRANENGLPQLVESVSSDVRAMLALFCYRRSHLYSLALSIAASCSERELIQIGGRVGSTLYALSREPAARAAPHRPMATASRSRSRPSRSGRSRRSRTSSTKTLPRPPRREAIAASRPVAYQSIDDHAEHRQAVPSSRHVAFGIAGHAGAAHFGPHGVNPARGRHADPARQRRAAIAVAAHARQPLVDEICRDEIERRVVLGGEPRPVRRIGAAGPASLAGVFDIDGRIVVFHRIGLARFRARSSSALDAETGSRRAEPVRSRSGCSQTRLLRHRARSRSRRSGYFSSR